MASIEMTVTVCDVCGRNGLDTKPYTVKQGSRERLLDLCERDSKPAEKLMALGSTRGATKRAAAKVATPGRRRRVTTMDEIEKQKRKPAKKAAAKKS